MFRDFLDLIFPDICISCGNSLLKGEKNICVLCRYKLPKTGLHLSTENPLIKKLQGRVPIRHGLAYLRFQKGGAVQNILHHIKYKGASEAATMLGYWYGEELYRYGFGTFFDIVLPVPLHRKKMRMRGYNQSACFGTGLAEGLQTAYSEQLMQRVREQSSQTNKGRLDRWSNVNGIYKVNNAGEVHGKRILLADDVATTGATIEVCAQQLLDAGAKEVSVAVIAMAM